MLSRTSDIMFGLNIRKDVDMLLIIKWAKSTCWRNGKLRVNYRFVEGVERKSKVKVVIEAVPRRCSVKKL